MRDGAPFGEDVWRDIDEMVVRVLSKTLVGRKVLDMVGPLGWGVEQAPVFGFSTDGPATATSASYLTLQEISEEFVVKAQQLAMSGQGPFKLDLGAVAIAATKLANREDKMLMDGLMAAASASAALGDWSEPNGPFGAIAEAVAAMRASGAAGPYALIINPVTYAKLASLMHGKGMGRRELDLVSGILGEGIHQTTQMPGDKALLLSSQSWNMDLVVGQDAVTAYLGNEGLDHGFRVFETLALRVKRPEAICVLS